MAVDTFTHLHVHSCASMMDGVQKPQDIAERAKELGMEAIALTDHGTLRGLYEFQQECDKVGVKPILGNEMYIVDDMHATNLSDEDKKGKSKEELKEIQRSRMRTAHLILLAENQKGLENLYTLNYHANRNGFYYRPRIDLDLLEQHSEGLIATTTCIISRIAKHFLNGEENLAINHFERMLDIFGKDNYFAEVHPHELDIQVNYNEFVIDNFVKKYGIEPIIANDAHYSRQLDNEAHKFLLSITTDDMIPGCKNLYIAGEDDMRKFWKENGHEERMGSKVLDQAFETTKHIAERCHARVDMDSQKAPEYDTPKGYDNNEQFIIKLMQDKFVEKLEKGIIPVDRKEEYMDRLKHEFNVIKQKGFLDYFLIVRDFIKWSKDNDILVGPGRGSATGSLLSWLLEIIEVDPVKYGLSFERFLNPERDKEPDIDTDLQDDKRKAVREYIGERWGEDNIAPIAAYSRYSSNSLFREVCKNLDYPFQEVNDIAKHIQTRDTSDELTSLKSFTDNLKDVEKLRTFVYSKPEEDRAKMVHLISAIEGNYRNLTTAAAGTIVSSKPLYTMMPLRRGKEDDTGKNPIVTEWDGRELTESKYLKIDMLGIATLTIIKKVMDRVGMTIQELYDMPVDTHELADDDEKEKAIYEKCYDEFRKGHTESIFQLEGGGITELTKSVGPTTILDLAAIGALYRPGTMALNYHNMYADRKNGRKKSTNEVHKAFEDILESTFGLNVYQEQTINIINRLGLNYGEADLMRKYMQEYNQEKIQYYRDKILDRPDSELFLPRKETEEVIDKVIDQAGYQFNLSHALGYAIIGFWTMYCKIKFPKEYCEEVLNEQMSRKPDALPVYISMTSNMFPDVEIDTGDINNPRERFEIKDGKLMFPVTLIKGIGKNVMNKLSKNEKKYSSFKNFYLDCIETKLMSDKNVANLIRMGYFSKIPFTKGFDINRRCLLACHEMLAFVCKASKRDRDELFKKLKIEKFEEVFDKKIMDKLLKGIEESITMKDFDDRELAILESEIIGFRINSSSEFVDAIKGMGVFPVTDYEDKHTPVWGKITHIQEKKTKNGNQYGVVKITDGETSISFKMWSNNLKKFGGMLINGNVVVVNLSRDKFGYTLATDKYRDTIFDEFSISG
jgi:DNA polymerase III subunit alpha